MALTALDDRHFYINEQLIDLVWIGYHVKKHMSAANHHELNRRLNWLHDLANRLLTDDTNEHDERTARKILRGLGYGWYFKDS